jgi:hypothetical protein
VGSPERFPSLEPPRLGKILTGVPGPEGRQLVARAPVPKCERLRLVLGVALGDLPVVGWVVLVRLEVRVLIVVEAKRCRRSGYRAVTRPVVRCLAPSARASD